MLQKNETISLCLYGTYTWFLVAEDLSVFSFSDLITYFILRYCFRWFDRFRRVWKLYDIIDIARDQCCFGFDPFKKISASAKKNFKKDKFNFLEDILSQILKFCSFSWKNSRHFSSKKNSNSFKKWCFTHKSSKKNYF